MGHGVAVHQQVARLHPIAFLDRDVAVFGNQVFARFRPFALRPHDDTPLGLVVVAELDPAGDLRNDGEILRLARLEQLRHPRQTTGDIARLARLPGDARQHLAGVNLLAVLDRKHGAHRHEIAGLLAIQQHNHLAGAVAQRDPRSELGAFRLLAPVDHDLAGDAGGLVHVLAHGDAFGQVHIVGGAGLLGDDRHRVRIPVGQRLAALHLAPSSASSRAP